VVVFYKNFKKRGDVFVVISKQGGNYNDRRARAVGYFKRTWMLYAMLILPAAFFIIFRYLPMTYLWMAFSDFHIFRDSVFDSPWVGLDHFRQAFALPRFWEATRNTFVLNLLDLAVGFPAPIILAILLNELKFKMFKRVSQTILYMPHFISWVVISGMAVQLFAVNMGMVNNFLESIGLSRINFLTDSTNWVRSYIAYGVWRGTGWGTILYLAAIAGINPELYEAADVDGANRLQKIIYVTIPCLMPTIVILLILSIGSMIGIEFDRPWVLRNSNVLDRAEVLSTLVYMVGIQTRQFSLAAAINIFQSVVNVFLLVSANLIAKRLGERGIW